MWQCSVRPARVCRSSAFFFFSFFLLRLQCWNEFWLTFSLFMILPSFAVQISHSGAHVQKSYSAAHHSVSRSRQVTCGATMWWTAWHFFGNMLFFSFFCWRSIVYFCREGAQLKVIAPKLASGTLASVVPGQVNGKKNKTRENKPEETNQRSGSESTIQDNTMQKSPSEFKKKRSLSIYSPSRLN